MGKTDSEPAGSSLGALEPPVKRQECKQSVAEVAGFREDLLCLPPSAQGVTVLDDRQLRPCNALDGF